jgi:hypothetical protein
MMAGCVLSYSEGCFQLTLPVTVICEALHTAARWVLLASATMQLSCQTLAADVGTPQEYQANGNWMMMMRNTRQKALMQNCMVNFAAMASWGTLEPSRICFVALHSWQQHLVHIARCACSSLMRDASPYGVLQL